MSAFACRQATRGTPVGHKGTARCVRATCSALYYWEGEAENTHGVTVTERFVRVFPVGPYLHCWTCGIEERTPKYATNPKNGWRSWHHPDANNADDIGTAVATALAVMRGEVETR